MRDYTMEQLQQWYSEAYNDLVAAVGKYALYDEQSKDIDDLTSEVKELKEEIARRKGEQG